MTRGMTRSRVWTLGAVGLVLVLLAASWFLLLAPKRSDAADLRAQDTAQQQTNEQLASQLQMLKAQAKELPAQAAKLAKVRLSLPDNPAMPSFIRSLTEVSAQTKVPIDSMTPGAPQAFVTAAKTGTAGVDTGIQTIPVTLAVHGDYFAVTQFINKLEGLERAVLVDGFTMAPGGTGTASASVTSGVTSAAAAAPADVSVTIQMRAFMAATDVVSVPGVVAAPTAAGATGTSSASTPTATLAN